MHRCAAALIPVALLTACATGGGSTATPHASPSEHPTTQVASPSPSAAYPAYYIEALRARSYGGGTIVVGGLMTTAAGFSKHQVAWTSQGQLMTGTISLPDPSEHAPVVDG